jgi:hypothetical protein
MPTDAAEAVIALNLGYIKEENDEDSGKGKKKPRARCAFEKAWLAFEQALNLEIAAGRAQKLKRAAPEAPAKRDADAERAATAALAAEDPLSGERIIDRARWDAASRLAGLNGFTLDAVCAYYIKLLVLEREAKFEAETGFNEYRQIYDGVLGEYNGRN